MSENPCTPPHSSLIKLSWTILIVEDEDHYFNQMEEELIKQARHASIALRIVRAVNLSEAQRKQNIYKPSVISTDICYPYLDGGKQDNWAGVNLVAILHDESNYIGPIIVYSGYENGEIKERLIQLIDKDKMPIILKKMFGSSHKVWASAIIEALHKR